MQNIINGIDKATNAGVFGLEEVMNIARSLDSLSVIVREHNQRAEAEKLSLTKNEGVTSRKKTLAADKI